MGNRCSGCCPSSPSESYPQSQSPPPQCPSEPHPQSQSAPPQSSSGSQAQGVDYERRFGDIKDATELKPLIDHVEQLLSGIEQAQSAHPVKTESNKVSAFVKGMIEPASQFLEKISTTGDELKKNNFAANLSGEMKTVISAAMENMGKLHWLALGFSVIAFVLDRIDQVSSNFNECVRLLRKMVDLAKRLQVLHTRMPHEIEKLNEAVRAIVEGAITCCCCMSQTKLFRYLLTSTNEANLDNIGKATEELERLLILMIAMDIQEQIPRYCLAEPEIPSDTVGIDNRIEKVIQLLDMESKGPARAVLLHGFGGVGKTTLAKCVMSKLDLKGIKHSSIQLGDKLLNENQQDLYFELKGERLVFKDCEAGRVKLKGILEERSTFIFIDNVLGKDQITELLPSQLSLPSGSRLLLTLRNVNVIEVLECRNIACKAYPVDELPEEAAKEYFRKTIIRSEQIIAALDRRDISLDNVDAVATACRGVPLLLRVYAQYLARRGTDRRVYDEMLDLLQRGEFHNDSEDHLSERLLYVYHKLSEDDQDAFVDICTYFHGWEEDDVSYIVSKTTLHDLIDGALVKIDESNKVIVHDVLKSLGIKEGKKTRIQSVQDLENAEEVNNIKGIWLPSSSCNLPSEILVAAKNRLRVLALGRKIRLTRQCDLPFSKLRFLYIENLHDLPTFYSKLPGNLRYLRIKTREFPGSLSSSKLSQRIWINLKSLGHLQKFAFECLEMTRFPNDCKLPESLIELDFSNCDDLQELPTELCNLTGLSKLKLDGCNSLKSLPEEFYNLSKLTYLSMEDCFDLQTLPANFGQLSSLGRLNLSGCSHLETLGEDFGGLSSLESLTIRHLDNLMVLPERFADLRKLRKLTIQVCRSLRSLPDSFGDLGTLQSLDLSNCEGLTCLPDRFGDLGTLQSLNLSGCKGLTCLPDRFGDLGTLQSLDLRWCRGLTCLPDRFGDLGTLQSLDLSGCGGLTCLPDKFGDLGTLQSLDLSSCGALTCLPDRFGDLGTLQFLNLSWCTGLTCLPDRFGDLGTLQSLNLSGLSGCVGLTCLLDRFGDLGTLQSLNLSSCGGLTCLQDRFGDLSTLQSLDLSWCTGLTCLPDRLGDLGTLQSLSLCYCSGLTCLPDRFGDLGTLQFLNLGGCAGLTCLPNRFGDLGTLQYLDLSDCIGLTCLPDRFGDLSSLQSLWLCGCRGLPCLPDTFGDLGTLQFLNLRGCGGLTCLPDTFGDLGNLQSLWLCYCSGLTCLPDRFGDLGTLQFLDLSGCGGLTCLPDRFGDLSTLQYLDLKSCRGLTCLPDRFGQLRNLQYLTMDECSVLTNLPNGFGNLKLLNRLWLYGCKNLSILPEKFGKLSGLKHLRMAKCWALKVLPNGFEDLRSVEYLDVSYCAELEGNTMERVVKLPNLKVLDIRHCPNLTKKWNKMEREKFPIWVKSVECQEEDSWQEFMRAVGRAILQNNCELVDVTGESIQSADFIQPGMTVAFLFVRYQLSKEMCKELNIRIISEKWQTIFIPANEDCKEEDVDKALERLPFGSRAIAHSETCLLPILGDAIVEYFGEFGEVHLCITDVQAEDGGGKHFSLRGHSKEV